MNHSDAEKTEVSQSIIDKTDETNENVSFHSSRSGALAKQQAAMQQLCEGLIISTRDFQADVWLSSLSKYKQEYGRLLYSEISTYIFSAMAQGEHKPTVDIFLANVENAIESASANDYPNKDVLLKFYDHASLAQHQCSLFSNNNEDVERLIDKKMNPVISKTTKELTSQLVGLVALFTAISFIVFGGITSLSQILSKVPTSGNILPTLLVVFLWLFGMLDFLFAFMYFVMRIVGCVSDNQKKQNFVQKHPIICISNVALLSVILVCLVLLFIQYNGIGKEQLSFITSHGTFSFWCLIVVTASLIIGACCYLYKQYKKEAKN